MRYNKRFFELDEAETKIIEQTCGGIPGRKALLDILPFIRMTLQSYSKNQEKLEAAMPGLTGLIHKIIMEKHCIDHELKIPGKGTTLFFDIGDLKPEHKQILDEMVQRGEAKTINDALKISIDRVYEREFNTNT